MVGKEGLSTSFLSLCRTLQLLDHSAFSCLENLTFQRQTPGAVLLPYALSRVWPGLLREQLFLQ